MNIWIESYTVLLECILTFYFFHRMLQPSYPSYQMTGVFYILYYGLFLYASLYFPMFPRMGILSLFMFIYYYFVLKQPGIKIFYSLIVFYITVAFADLFSGAALTLMGIPVQKCLGTGAGRFIYNTVAKVMHLLLSILFITVTRRRYDARSLRRAIPLILCNAASFIILSVQFESFIDNEHYTPFILSTVAVLLINIVICVYTEYEKYFYMLQERQHIMAQQLEYQEKYYQDTIALQEESRSLWHDMKKYMLAMETMVSGSRSEEANEQLLFLTKSLEHLKQVIHTGNQMVDGILNYGMQKANSANVKIDFDLWIDPVLNFPTADFYIIVGNTIDNAVDACSAISTPELASIRLTLRQQNHVLLYEISNPIPSSPVKKAGKIHGYGLDNVKECVRRNQGVFSVSTEKGFFCVTITLNV
ncbi:MAG: ATP-binding protein [Lachnospiraceae bacterium]|nr:ATP-binding protein [Lachnospiraceae bacterium]